MMNDLGWLLGDQPFVLVVRTRALNESSGSERIRQRGKVGLRERENLNTRIAFAQVWGCNGDKRRPHDECEMGKSDQT